MGTDNGTATSNYNLYTTTDTSGSCNIERYYNVDGSLQTVTGVPFAIDFNSNTISVEKDEKQTMNFKISKLDVFNNKVVKTTFSDGKVERAICDEEDEFDLKIGVFICISKYLYKDTLTNHGIYIKALELSWYKEYNKIVDKAIKDYYKNLDKEIKEKEEKQLEKEKAARRKIKNNIRKAKQKKKKIENEVETILNYLEKRNKSEVVKENEK